MQSSEQKSKGNKELKILTVYVTVKGVTGRIATVSKEIMSCGALKATNKKLNQIEKNEMIQQQPRL